MNSSRPTFDFLSLAVTMLVAAGVWSAALAEGEIAIQVTPSARQVLAGEVIEDEPNLVVIEEAVSLLPGYLVDTDRLGEALLEAFVADQEVCTANLYRTSRLLFWSQLNTSACSKAELGSSRCLELSLGSALFHGCGDFLVMTPNGQVQVTGTTFFIEYLPEVQTTVIQALEGVVEARLLPNVAEATFGEAVVIEQGQMLFATAVADPFTLAGQSVDTPFELELAPQVYADLAEVYVSRDLIGVQDEVPASLDFSYLREKIGLRLPQLLPQLELESLPALRLYDLRQNQLPVPDGALAVGVVWGVDFDEYRWNRDEIAFAGSLEASGATYLPAYAVGSVARQLEEAERLIRLGVDTLVLVTPGGDALLPIVELARQAGVAVVAYDGLIASPDVVNLAFDDRNAVPLLTPEVVLEALMIDNVVVPDLGVLELVTQPFTLTGPISESRIVPQAEVGFPSGQAAVILENLESSVVESIDATLIDPNVSALIVADPTIAVIAEERLAEQGRSDAVELIGRAETTGMFQLIAQGSLDAAVWEDSRQLARRAAEVAVDLARGTPISALAGLNDRPADAVQNAIWIDAELVDGAGLADVLESGWIAREVVCQGALVGACQ